MHPQVREDELGNCREREQRGELRSRADLRAALMEGAVLRVRPKAMTMPVLPAAYLLIRGRGLR